MSCRHSGFARRSLSTSGAARTRTPAALLGDARRAVLDARGAGWSAAVALAGRGIRAGSRLRVAGRRSRCRPPGIGIGFSSSSSRSPQAGTTLAGREAEELEASRAGHGSATEAASRWNGCASGCGRVHIDAERRQEQKVLDELGWTSARGTTRRAGRTVVDINPTTASGNTTTWRHNQHVGDRQTRPGRVPEAARHASCSTRTRRGRWRTASSSTQLATVQLAREAAGDRPVAQGRGTVARRQRTSASSTSTGGQQ